MSGEIPDFLSNDRLGLLFFGGKGGVGKTTCSVASALRLAATRPNERVVLVSFDPAHSVADCLAAGETPKNLTVVEFDAESFHERYMSKNLPHFKAIAERGTFLDGSDIDALLDLSMPGVDEFMGFLQLAEWIDDDAYDTFVIDTAPTGHALRLLSMPEFIGSWLEAIESLLAKHRYMASVFGNGAEDATESFVERVTDSVATLHAAMTDGEVCRFVPVMLAEPLSSAESADLFEALDTLGIVSSEVVVNRIVPADSGPELARARRDQIRELRNGPAVDSARTLWISELRGTEPVGPVELLALASSWRSADPELTGEAVQDGTDAGSTPLVTGAGAAVASSGVSLLVFAGKGGVGKTTMACAAAVAAARDGRAVTLISTDPAGSLEDCLRMTVGSEPTPILPGLSAMQLDAASEFESLREAYRSELSEALDDMVSGADLAFDGEAMQSLIDLSPPGLDEVMALTRVSELMRREGGLVVLDTAPTGHLLRLLELPELIEQWIKALFDVFIKYDSMLRLPTLQARLIEISRGIKSLRSTMTGPGSTVVPVTIPTTMALAETVDLVGAVGSLGMHCGSVIVNQVTPTGQHPLVRAIATRESAAIERFSPELPMNGLVRVTRGGDVRGLDALTKLASSMYPPEQRVMGVAA